MSASYLIIKLLNLIQRYWLSVTLFFLVIITIFSLTPLKELPPVPGSDKAHHFVAYAALIFPAALRKFDYWLLVGLFFVCWSGLIELIQPYVNRYGEVQDMVANTSGLLCGVILAILIRHFVILDSNPE